MVKYNEQQLGEKLEILIDYLLKDSKGFSITIDEVKDLSYSDKRLLFHELCLARKPSPLSPEFLRIQNDFLTYEKTQKDIIDVNSLVYVNNMSILLADIVDLKTDAIVCSCKENLIGSLHPHDDAISHDVLAAGGLQVKQELNYIITKQNQNEQRGHARIIKGYNLPASYIICTVGPKVINGRVGYNEKESLVNCYNSCLNLAKSKGLKTIAFCSISTGSNKFPKELASDIAISTVSAWLKQNNNCLKVVFCLEDEKNKKIYEDNFNYYIAM